MLTRLEKRKELADNLAAKRRHLLSSSADSGASSSSMVDIPSPHASSAGSFAHVPEEIIYNVGMFLGPTRSLVSFSSTNRRHIFALTMSCWQSFRLERERRLELWTVGKELDCEIFRFFENKRASATFRGLGCQITSVKRDDCVVFLNASICDPNASRYIEIECLQNEDNFSFALVDFDGDGSSSVTYSPETGAIIKERKLTGPPKRVEGVYAVVPSCPDSQFRGKVGMFVENGKLAFLKKSEKANIWETTDFCVNLNWLVKKRMTPCIAFRDKGKYSVKISSVCEQPPIPVKDHPTLLKDSAWTEIDWYPQEAEDITIDTSDS